MSQALYELPEGWAWKRLDEVCEYITDGAHASPVSQEKGLPYVTVKDIASDGSIDVVGCKKISQIDFDLLVKANCSPRAGAVLLSKDGTVGKVALVDESYEQFVILSSLAIIHPNSSFLISNFLKYYLQSPLLQEEAIGKKSGAAIKRIVLKTIKAFEIPLPPLAEQIRIVEKLDAVLSRIDTAIDELQQSLALVDAFYKSSLKAKTNDLEGKWTRYSLNELGCFSGGGTPSKSRSDYWDGKILWITPKDMKSWKLSDSEMKITDIGLKESSAKLLPKNSVLIVARSGILQHTLPVAINTVEATVNQDIKVFIPSDKIMAEYVQYMLKGHEAFILSQLVKGGVTVESLKYSEFQEHPFPVPDLQAQIQIVGELDALNDKTTQLKTELAAKIGMFNQLKASVLDGAFRGLI